MNVKRIAFASALGCLLFATPARASDHVYFFHNDHLGTPQAMSDLAGRKVWEAEYEPFGMATETTATITNNLRLPGQYYDVETGLHYNYHRDYDSGTGRYLQPDPTGLEGGLNLYTYADSNATMFFDPDALSVEKCCGMTSDMPKAPVMTGLECMSKCLKSTIYISSGWRNDKQNKSAGGAGESYHLKGLAADVHTPPSRDKLRKAAAHCSFYVLPKQYPDRIHVDCRGNRTPRSEPDECECKKIRGEQ
jgi:RHS repeat-associated protein